jgi:hypothetical protein
LNTDNPLGWNGKVASEYAELLEKVRFAQNWTFKKSILRADTVVYYYTFLSPL